MKEDKITPQEVEHLFAAGWAALQTGPLSDAEEAFLGVLAVDPSHADALNALGTVYFHEKRLDDAWGLHEKARQVTMKFFKGKTPTHLDWNSPHDKSLIRSLHSLALVSYRRGETKDAEKRFSDLLKLNPKDNTGAKLLLADIKKGRKRWD